MPPVVLHLRPVGRLLGVLVLSLGMAGSERARGDESIAPPAKRFAESLTYDPATGQWKRSPEPVPGTVDGDLDIARQWLARGDFETAVKAIKAWIGNYGTDQPRHPEALYLLASAELEAGEYRDAEKHYEELLNSYPGSPYAEDALSGRFRVAEQYLAGKRRKTLWGLLRLKARDEGVKMLDDTVANYADTALAENAQMTKADYFFDRGEFDLAEGEYAAFAREYPRSRWHPRAMYRSGLSALASFPGVQYDDAPLIEARERFARFNEAYPAAAEQLDVPVLVEEIERLRADKNYEIGWFYERTGKFQAARFYYRYTIEHYPNTPAAGESRGRLAVLGEPVEVYRPEMPPASKPATATAPDEEPGS